MNCPICSKELVKNSRTGIYRCEDCNKEFKIAGLCDKCGSKVEKLAACGSVSFWCNSCNELKSKSKVEKIIEEL